MTMSPGNHENVAYKGISLESAVDITVRAGLPQADLHRILALPYPVEHWVFWEALAGVGVTQERVRDHMGASP